MRHYTALIDTAGGRQEPKPVVVGHSFGGLIAQELLAGGHAAAAVAIDPAPIKGVKALPLSQLRSAFPVLRNPANRHRTVSLSPKQFRYAFGNAISEEESNALHEQWTIPGPGRPLFEDAAADFVKHSPAEVDTHLVDGGPLLLTSGSDAEFHEFEGRGHSLTIDSGWRDVADVALAWLEKKGF
ncbi:MAG: alpha/beta fold hydrolase [Paludibaculum sp.]